MSDQRQAVSGETMFHLPKACQIGTHILESTSRGMDGWWRKNLAPERRGGRTIYRGPWQTVVEPTVTWIDDRNEARRLGITVEELETSRQVARRMNASEEDADSLVGRVRLAFQLDVPHPRFHGQLTQVTS